MALTTRIVASIAAALTASADHTTPRADPELVKKIELASGIGAGQADKIFSDQRTIAASLNDDLDLAGVLTDLLGVSLTIAKVKAIFIVAAAGNVNNVVIGGAASNPFLGPFADASDKIVLRPGNFVMLYDPTGWTVTGGAADTLRIANSGGGSSVIYDIIIVGTSG